MKKINKILKIINRTKETKKLPYSVKKIQQPSYEGNYTSARVSLHCIDGTILDIYYDSDNEQKYEVGIIVNQTKRNAYYNSSIGKLKETIKKVFRKHIRPLELKPNEYLYCANNVDDITEQGKCYMWASSENVSSLEKLGYKKKYRKDCDDLEILLIDVEKKKFTITYKHDEARFLNEITN